MLSILKRWRLIPCRLKNSKLHKTYVSHATLISASSSIYAKVREQTALVGVELKRGAGSEVTDRDYLEAVVALSGGGWSVA